MSSYNALPDLTAEQITDMTPEEILAYIARQKELADKAIENAGKGRKRKQWELMPQITANIGYVSLYYKPENLDQNKNPFCSLFLYETQGRARSYAITHIAIKDPEQSKVDRIRSNFIKRILDTAQTNFEDISRTASSWKSPVFDRTAALPPEITRLTIPLQMKIRMEKTPNEWTDQETGELRQGYKYKYGFALDFESGINDYAQELTPLAWQYSEWTDDETGEKKQGYYCE